MYTMYIISSRGQVYFMDMQERRLGMQFFQIVRSQADYIPRILLHHKMWLGLDDFVRVKYYNYNLNYYDLYVAKHGIALIRVFLFSKKRYIRTYGETFDRNKR